MNILLLNLTRLGDLLEMQPVIAGLRNTGENLRIGLVCLENFAAAAHMLDGLDDIYPLPAASLLAGLDRKWTDAALGVTRFRDTVQSRFLPDRILNLTPTLPARLLARLLAGPEGTVEGFGLDSMGFAVNASPWVAFTQTASSQRGSSPYNLTDQFRMIAGAGAGEGVNILKRPLASDAVSDLLRGHDGARGFVGLQLGASEARRRWPVRFFVDLARDLWTRGFVSVLLGSKDEADLGARFADALACADAGVPHINAVGKTRLPELADLLTRLSLLATNDTGTMHLAAGLGTPVLAFFLATAQPWDTGPYMEGACCLEPDMDCHPCAFGAPCTQNQACREAIPSSLAAYLAGHFLEHGVWPNDLDGQGARVWHSAFGDNPDGFLDLVSLSGHEQEDRTRWIRIQRSFYRQFLDRNAAPVTPPDFSHGLSPATLAHAESELSESIQRLHLLYEQAGLLQMRPSEQTKSRVIANLSRVQAAWSQSRLFSVLGYLWLCETEQAETDLVAMRLRIADYRAFLEVWLEYLKA